MLDKPTSLTGGSITAAIEEACRDFSSNDEDGWKFSPAQPTHFHAERAESNSSELTASTKQDENTLLHGIVATQPSSHHDSTYLVTFFLAYSTWDGRCLTRDYSSQPDMKDNDQHLDWFPLLARIAKSLECQRLVWYHHGCKGDYLHTGRNPERLPGWLTLNWSVQAMKEFAGANMAITKESTINSDLTIGDHIVQVLQDISSLNGDSKFSIRLASAGQPNDIKDIVRLVHGLAVFEKEPESVHVGAEHYIADGGFDKTTLQLYYCLLIDAPLHTKPDEHYTCGMAFCYVGHNVKGGRFLYLEDLFIEEAYRGQGVGTLVMKTLATLALSLGCKLVKWQALDWNTPALTFYNKIGATVQEGLETSRFVGESLIGLAGN